MKRTIEVGLYWALVMILLFFPIDAAAQEGRIQGSVVVGDAPVDDADVVIPGLGRRLRVDGAGRFSFDAVPPGRYVLEAQSVRWGRGVQSVDVTAGGTAIVTIMVEAVFHLDEMVVSAGAGSTRRSEAYQPASVMTSRDLVISGEASLGETLTNEPGVSSTFFGPGSSRPVIRGMGGDRVRVLEGGIGTGDASSTSPDHAVAVEARNAERIEVVRGPATLLYGSSAVGGVVNVLDDRIAREPPTQPFSGYLEGLAGSVADEWTGSGALTARFGPLVVTGSGLYRDAGDYSIPGIAEAFPEPGETPESGMVENSSVSNRRANGGVTYVTDRGYLGVAYAAQRSDYGVPGHNHEDPGVPPAEEEGPVTIDMEQDRVDVEGALRFGSSAVRNLKGRFGYTDYQHSELEDAEVGTRFYNNYFEGRLESEHSFSERSQGAFGTQFSSRDFGAIGDEAFLPPSTTKSIALFVYEELIATESLRVQGGLRFERQTAEATGVAERIQSAISTSLGANWDATDLLSLSVSVSRSAKLPNAEELFSDGPHAATRAYEIGDPELSKEVALGVDVTAHVHGDRFRGSASFFTTGFDDYIYESATGVERNGLTEFEYVQGNARFTGAEFEFEFDIVENDPAVRRPHVSVDLIADFVTAKLTESDEYLPRIPPGRFGGGVNFRQNGFVVRVGARHTAKQNRLGPFETPTPGYTMIESSISYRLFTGGIFHDISLAGTNLTDAEARVHSSFLKDMVPLPGRGIRLIYRLNFGN